MSLHYKSSMANSVAVFSVWERVYLCLHACVRAYVRTRVCGLLVHTALTG